MMNPGKVILGFLILLVSGISNAQETAISGKVSDENGVGLPGVGVLIKGTSTGMATDVEGNYKLNASPDDILVFSFVGYLSEEIAVGSQTIINVQLIPDLTQLEEIIVIGYGETKKRDLTGSVSSAPMEDMSYAPVASFDGALAGRVAGVQITSSQGRPGAPSVVKIRGNGSLTQSSTPLYVIDGFPIEDFDVTSIDQSDIESIEVLKGPSAVAIYGSRGGNGVILITSKTGVEGKVQVSYNGFYGIEEITKRVNVLSPYDFVDLRYEVDSLSAVDMYGPIELYQNSDGSSIGGIDWQDEVFDQTNVMSNTLSVNGGTKDTKYNISVSRYEAGGLLENSGFERNYATVNLDQRLSEKLRAGVNVSYTSALITGTHTSTNILNPDVDGGGSSSSRFNLLKDIVQGRPTGGLFISNEELLTLPEDPDTEEGAPITNPLVNAKTQIREDRRNTLLFNGYLKYTIIEGLDLRVSGGIQRLDRRRDAFDEVNSAFERRNGFARGSIISS